MKHFPRLKPPIAALAAAAVFLFSSVPSSAEEPDTDYGASAYSFLETLVTSYPARTNEENNNRSQAVQDAGDWIQSQLESFGYTVGVQEYVHPNYIGTNYYVTKPGTSDQIICVGAHYDSENTDGADDNASGVGVLLELAQRFADVETPCTIQFVFFDGEENGGYVGSCQYINFVLTEQELLDKILCYINIDSVGAGDRLYAYGGVYEDDGTLTQIWPYQLAMAAAEVSGIPLYTLPEEVASHPDEDLAFRSPTRITGSDQHYFQTNGIPYVYFEASLWYDGSEDGGNDQTRLTCHYQTANPAFASTGGQIMHTEFDDLDTLNQLLPGRLQENMAHTSQIISSMLMEITEDTPKDMADLPYTPTEAMTESAQTPESSSETDESGTDESEASSESDSFEPQQSSSQSGTTATLQSNHSLILMIFGFAGAMILLLVGFIIYSTASGTRRRRRRKRFNRKKKKKKNRFE